MKKTTILLLLLSFTPLTLWCQVEKPTMLPSFNKVIVSPLIDLVIMKGDEERIVLESQGGPLDQVEVTVIGKTLKVFLRGARMIAKKHRSRQRNNEQDVLFDRPSYNVSKRITAYVTYVQLERMQFRGENEVNVKGTLEADHFKLRAYGSADIHFDHVDIDRMKLSLYGDHKVTIDSGTVQKQIYLAYGDNKVDALSLNGSFARTSFYGDNRISMNVSDMIKVTSLGESDVYYQSGPYVRKGIVIGDFNLRRLR